MSIPPHRTAGELGHIEDHNAIVDVLTGNDTDIAANAQDFADHLAAEDAHGDRAWATGEFSPIGHTHVFPVTSVNAETGDVVLDANDVGAETPSGAQTKVNDLQDYVDANYIHNDQKGVADGVTPLNASGVIDVEYIPGFGGGSRVTVSDTEPPTPNEGDIWVNTSEQVPDPTPIMPTYFDTVYVGDRYLAHSDLPTPGIFETFPAMLYPAITFTTGATGRTVIKTTGGVVNNASTTSTTAVSYNIVGDGVSITSDFDKGVYQHPRGLQSSSVSRLFVQDEFDLPPDTEVTLTPTWRLSSVPSQADQDQTADNSIRVAVDETMNTIRVECW